MTFQFEPLPIPDVILVKPDTFQDERGFFMESYKRSAFCEGGIEDRFVQDNYSRSVKHTLRGLHFQIPPAAHAKLVSVVQGEILDVAVDIRRGSPTFSQWVGARLSATNHHQLYIPVGFAHGFLVLSETADVTYKISAEYAPASDRGIAWDDPALAIAWGTETPILSAKDKKQPKLSDTDTHFVYKESS